MMTLTHLTAGAAAVGALLQTTNPVLLGIGAIAALMPDVDLSVSPAGRVLFFVSWWLEKRFPHRGPTHSIFFCGILTAVVYAASIYLGFNQQIAIAFGLGYFIGGVFPDCFTKSGAAIFWPLDTAPWWCPDNHRFRLSTGSRAEYVFLTCLVAVALVIFSTNNKGGLEIQFGRLLGTSSGVEQVYNRYGNNQLITLTVNGFHTSDRAPVQGEFILIEPDGSGFIARNQQGELFKIGVNGQINATKITAKPGRKAKTLIQNIQINDNAIAHSLAQLYQAQPGAEIYLSGSILLEDPEEFMPIFQPGKFPFISKSGNSAELKSAPLIQAYQALSPHWGTGQLIARIIYAE